MNLLELVGLISEHTKKKLLLGSHSCWLQTQGEKQYTVKGEYINQPQIISFKMIFIHLQTDCIEN